MHTDYFFKHGCGTYKVQGSLFVTTFQPSRGVERPIYARLKKTMQVRWKVRNLPVMLFRRVRRIAKSNFELRKVCLSIRLSFRMENTSAPTGHIFVEFNIWVFFQKSVDKVQVSLRSNKNSGYFTWISIHIFLYLAQFFLECKMFQRNFLVKFKAHISRSVTFFFNIVPFMK